MSEMVCRAADCCLRVMDHIDSTPTDELPKNEIRMRLQKIVDLLRGFEKKAWLKTRKGNEAAQEIEGAAINLEKTVCSVGSSNPSLVMEGLTILEQRVEVLQKAVERMKRMVT